MYPGIRKYDKKVKTVFNVSGAIHVLNKVYHKSYKLVDLAYAIGVSTDTICRLSEGSQFCIVYNIAYQLYLWYPDLYPGWSFEFYLKTFCICDQFKLSHPDDLRLCCIGLPVYPI